MFYVPRQMPCVKYEDKSYMFFKKHLIGKTVLPILSGSSIKSWYMWYTYQ